MQNSFSAFFFPFIFAVLTAAVLGTGAIAGWNYLFDMPYRIWTDCRGKGITVENIKEWEKQQEKGFLGILRITGWRIEEQQTILSVNTGRKQTASIFCVYGPMELAQPAEIRCGRNGLPIEDGYCVLSEKLARQLFGSTEIAGEEITVGENTLPVAGVIKKEEEILFIPVKDGEIEMLAIEFDNRINAEKRFKELTGFSYNR